MSRSGIIARSQVRHAYRPQGQADVILSLLHFGAGLIDPGNLTPATEEELERRTQAGELECRIDHGRRLWRRR